MPPRTNLAQEHFYARLRRWGCQQVTVEDGDSLNLTPYCPTAADIGFEGERAPAYDLRVLFPNPTPDGGMAGMVAATVGPTSLPNYPDRVISEVANEVFIPTLWPRVGGNLVSPLGNRLVYLRNYSSSDIDAAIVFEIPDLAPPEARELPTRGRQQMFVEWAHSPVVRLGNVTVTVEDEDYLEITAYVPHLGQIDGAPWVNLLALWALYEGIGPPDFSNTLLCAVTDAAVPVPANEAVYAPEIYDTQIQHQRIVVPQLCPRLDANATTLLDGCRVFLVNIGLADVSVGVSFEVPSMHWQ